MTNTDSQPPIESTHELVLSYQLLKDQGLELDDGDYSLGNMTKMRHSVRVVNEFGSGLPQEVKVECMLRFEWHLVIYNNENASFSFY